MNANELADELEQVLGIAGLKNNRISMILRQQQAEIEALKKQVIGDDYVFVCKRCGDELGIKFEAQEK